jgi:hypothetical protein
MKIKENAALLEVVMQSASMRQAEGFLEMAARCRTLATTCPNIELSAAFSELADQLTARAGKLDQSPAEADGDQHAG